MASNKYRVLITSAAFEPGFRGGGPIKSVARIIDSAPTDTEIVLLTSDRDIGSPAAYPGLSGRWKPRRQTAEVYYLNTRRPGQWLRLLRAIRTQKFDLIYTNSLWNPAFTVVPLICQRIGLIKARGILIAPRGELSPGAVTLRAQKKHLFLTLSRPLLNRPSVGFHASTELERDDIIRYFPRASVYISFNMVDLHLRILPPIQSESHAVKLVFISRISPKKGLLTVIEAMRKAAADVQLDIFGPIEDEAYWRACELAAASLPDPNRVAYRGELRPGSVRATFRQYDAFVFPSRGENFGHVIAESLSSSCPVICSSYTPWTSVLQGGGGAVIAEYSANALARKIDDIVSSTPEQRLISRINAGNAYLDWVAQRPTVPHLFDALRAANRTRELIHDPAVA